MKIGCTGKCKWKELVFQPGLFSWLSCDSLQCKVESGVKQPYVFVN